MSVADQDPQQLKASLLQMDERLAQARQDLRTFHSWFDTLQAMNENIAQLENFYYNDEWIALAEKIQTLFPDECFECCGEDGVWDVSQMFYNLQLSMIKRLSDNVYARIPEYYREDGMFENSDGDAS